jgi:hypothetical protein
MNPRGANGTQDTPNEPLGKECYQGVGLSELLDCDAAIDFRLEW